MDLGLHGKVALVTGASRGLGFAIATLLAQEGSQVVINSRNNQKIMAAINQIRKETGQPVEGIAGDLVSHNTAEEIIQYTVEKFGALDILVANAGGPPAGSFLDFDDQAWQNAVELSFLSNVRLIRAALPHLKKSSSPSILTITSYSVKQPIPNMVLSNSIRSATIGLTKSLAMEIGPFRIRVNSILPGWTATERITELMRYRANTNNTTIEEELEKQARESALGRISQPEEFAKAAVFLVSPAASYITGVMLNVDGGIYKGIF
jgi:3-oxoacyl-[acyl-carrier protein] reductase